MNKLAIGTALTGALALGVLTAPAAQASTPSLTFADVTVNKGKPIVVGATATVKVPVTYTRTRPSDLTIDNKNNYAGIVLYRGTLKRMENSAESDTAPVCSTTSTTPITVTESCSEAVVFDPEETLYDGDDATTWKAAGYYTKFDQDDDDSDGHVSYNFGYDLWANPATAKVQRGAKVTADASPEPVKKGKTLTVKGKLTRANWQDNTYAGYKGQKVTLQFRAKGSSTYQNVKGITSATGGALTTTVQASKSGYYRFTFAGTSTTGKANSAGDYVEVK